MAVGVVVEIKVKEGQEDAYLGYMREMIALTKQENGCIAYDLYKPVDGDGIVMIEIWENKDALDKHMDSEHFKKYVPGAEIYLDGPSEIKILNRL